MRASRRLLAAAAAVAVVAAACTETGEAPSRGSARKRWDWVGGTLRVAVVPVPGYRNQLTLDPQADWFPTPWTLFRCCLGRTLLSYEGTSAREGGIVLRPDLAAGLPEVSADRRTWRFRLQRGLRYAPPFQDQEIVAGDVVRALERTARLGGQLKGESYAFYYRIIQGFDEVMQGEAESISGLETPDDHTLLVHVTRASGNLGALLAMPATIPIPAAGGSRGRLGAAEGHDDGYGRFLVASGPYMLERSQELDFTLPPSQQEPVAGFVPNEEIRLVRNPSWEPSSDALRPAYPDRIEISIGATVEQAAERVVRGEADLLLYAGSPPQVPPDMMERFPRLERLEEDRVPVRVLSGTFDVVRYVRMNVAQPPFDDVHVRKAANHAIDKAAILDARGGPDFGEVATHIVPDSLEDHLLSGYDPYETDLQRAKEEMRQSRYDRDGDGVCDDPACEDVRALTYTRDLAGSRDVGRLVSRDLAAIGIDLDIQAVERDELNRRLSDPTARIALGINTGWGKDFPNASSFIVPLFLSENIGPDTCCNDTLVGAAADRLHEWGYPTPSVPSVDDKVAECEALVGDEQVRCWAETDVLLMERVVPWVPLVFESHVSLISSRVVASSFDQFSTLPALDRFAVDSS